MPIITTTKILTKFANSVAYQKEHDFDGMHYNWWYSKIDDSIIGTSLEDFRKFLNRGITDQLQNRLNKKNHSTNIGFNPKEQKWYGITKDGVFQSFGIGSKITKECVYYIPENKDEFYNRIVTKYPNKTYAITQNDIGIQGILIICEHKTFIPFPDTFRGEWEAKNLNDAKQMAIDFAGIMYFF